MAKLTLEQVKALYDKKDSLSKEDIQSIQQFLIDNGYNVKGGADGVFGPSTQKAVEEVIAKSPVTSEAPAASPVNDVIDNATKEGLSLDQAAQELQQATNTQNTSDAQNNQAVSDFKKGRDYAKTDVYNIAQTGVDAIKTAQALGQIRQGSQASAKLAANRPNMPQQLPSEDLQRAAQEAQAASQYGLGDRTKGYLASRDLASYANSLAAARTAGAGQAGVMGSVAQGLSRNIMERNLQTAAADEEARLAKQQYSGGLAGAQANQQANMYGNQLQYGYAPRLAEYQQSLAEARNLQQAGNINLSNQLGVMPYRAANMAYNYYNTGQQRGYQPIQGTPEYNQMMQEKAAQGNYALQQQAIESMARKQATQQWLQNRMGSVRSAAQGVGNWWNKNVSGNYQEMPIQDAKQYYDQPQVNPYYGIPQNTIG